MPITKLRISIPNVMVNILILFRLCTAIFSIYRPRTRTWEDDGLPTRRSGPNCMGRSFNIAQLDAQWDNSSPWRSGLVESRKWFRNRMETAKGTNTNYCLILFHHVNYSNQHKSCIWYWWVTSYWFLFLIYGWADLSQLEKLLQMQLPLSLVETFFSHR